MDIFVLSSFIICCSILPLAFLVYLTFRINTPKVVDFKFDPVKYGWELTHTWNNKKHYEKKVGGYTFYLYQSMSNCIVLDKNHKTSPGVIERFYEDIDKNDLELINEIIKN